MAPFTVTQGWLYLALPHPNRIIFYRARMMSRSFWDPRVWIQEEYLHRAGIWLWKTNKYWPDGKFGSSQRFQEPRMPCPSSNYFKNKNTSVMCQAIYCRLVVHFIMGQLLQLGARTPTDENMSSFAPLRGFYPPPPNKAPSNYRVNDLLNPEPSQYISPRAVHIPWAVYRTFE